MHQVSVTEHAKNMDESQKRDNEEILDSTEEWMAFESKGTKELREHANTIIINERKASRAARKEYKLLRIEAKKKKE